MKKIIDQLYVGTEEDILIAKYYNDFSILGACKEPLHRKYAKLKGSIKEGYMGRAMPKDEPEYFYAEREHALYLNLIDAKESRYIPDICIEKAIEFINEEIGAGRDVLIVCNKAESRSPSIALMWMIKNDIFYEKLSFEELIKDFTNYYYFNYRPSNGMREYVKKYWEDYQSGKAKEDFR